MQLKTQNLIARVDEAEVGVAQTIEMLQIFKQGSVSSEYVKQLHVEFDMLKAAKQAAEEEETAATAQKLAEQQISIKTLNRLLTEQQEECARLRVQVQVVIIRRLLTIVPSPVTSKPSIPGYGGIGMQIWPM